MLSGTKTENLRLLQLPSCYTLRNITDLTKMLFKIFITILFISFSRCTTNEQVVTTPSGKIRGYVKTSPDNNKFSAFEGIPYAKPPVGDKRFKEPEPIEPWKGIWEANFRTECAHTEFSKPKIIKGEEDCLYLNVYVPGETIKSQEKFEVIVHIHGGNFMSGSGHSYADPGFFMDRNVILVTFNYRLGVLGFLSTEDDVVSGNNGLKDQVLALKWIKDNIASFGGNSDSVTITGLSSGAASVHYHYLSDMSRGLFHRGFSQSGVALNPLALQDEPLQKAKILGHAVDCPRGSTKVLVACLKQRPFRHLLTKMSLFYGYKFAPFAPFGPVIEKGSKTFINKNPYYLMAKGYIQNLPWLVSNTAQEGLFPAAYIFNDLENVNDNWTEIAPFLLDFNHTLAKPVWPTTAETIKNYYFGENQQINKDSFLKLVQMFTDRLFLTDTHSAIALQAKFNKSPVFYYRFSYPGDHNTFKTVAHGEDAQYFFYNIFKRETSENEIKMKEIMMDMLVSFAKDGIPRIGDIAWEPVKFNKINYLNISSYELTGIKMETSEELAPRKFWQSLGFLENQNLVLIKDEL